MLWLLSNSAKMLKILERDCPIIIICPDIGRGGVTLSKEVASLFIVASEGSCFTVLRLEFDWKSLQILAASSWDTNIESVMNISQQRKKKNPWKMDNFCHFF